MFISVKEAMELSGMSSTSIYRLCNKRINTLYVRKVDNKFIIDKDFLLATYPPDIINNTETAEPDYEPTPMNKEIQTESKKIQEKTEANQILEPEDDGVEIDFVSNSPNIHETGDIIELIVEPEIVEKTNSNQEHDAIIAEMIVSNESKSVSNFGWKSIIGIFVSLLFVSAFIYLIYMETL
jgi:hypothetical protein